MTNEQKDLAQEKTDLDAEQTQANEQNEASTVSVDELQAQLSKLEDALKLEKARAANAMYEAEKVKERLEREADTAKKFALEKFAKSLLEPVDNLERAILATGNEESPLLEGVQLTLKSLLSALEKQGIVAVDTNNGFNADFHQAVGIAPETQAGEIGNVLQKGYTLAGRLLRPAMVTVGQ
ncbi:nucleotide exchange factor GrpE [Acinetobacter boissieri]|uniref:Protein GrpE n=1 Tax=Acinetobacter boissieri TaxID=1219383 RepID=A0A1G6K2F1_9GAMM|nr:nucleotide exchange factor GrpE [Acinetobacter boissieri]SDC25068.1 molecular chaperone GrpE [Acinetobacter boissieri]